MMHSRRLKKAILSGRHVALSRVPGCHVATGQRLTPVHPRLTLYLGTCLTLYQGTKLRRLTVIDPILTRKRNLTWTPNL